jgi:DNA/RNA-binding domain of Phe-tRNA-synthetase-like protein
LVEIIIEGKLEALYPGLGVSCARLDGLTISAKDEGLEAFKGEVFKRVRKSVRSLDEVKDLPIVRAYRDFFWRVGLDPTKVRPAGEALARRIISGRGIPTINTFVDSYNLASAETFVPIAAFDLSSIGGNLLMRRAKIGESFLGIGMDSPLSLKGVEVVIEDRRDDRLVAVYPYRDADAGKVSEKSRDALAVACGVPGVDKPTVERARELAVSYVLRYSGGTSTLLPQT